MRREHNEEGAIERVFDGAVSVDHAPPPDKRIVVAPTAAGEFNTLQVELTPVACVQLSDVLFEFDSSVVRPDARAVMKSLARLREEDLRIDPDAIRPASVFGHADPTGNDDYNKQLAGRRAQAIYGLLTRDTDLWEDLYQNPLGGDDWRGAAIASMARALGRDPQGASDKSARAALFKDYMDLICVDDDEQPFTLDPATDFIAGGQDPDGKGDYQGCGEFNPIRVFSRQEQQRFNAASNKAERNRENAPNRRVVIFLFRAGTRVQPDRWPCPRAKEGVAACHKRFHTDGNRRRNPQNERREFATDGDTFACRFYHHRIATLSPCERVLPARLCCKQRGIVVDNVDPLGVGRLRVDVPDVFEGEPQFAMPAVPYAPSGFGFSMLPPIGANVWIDFEQGDINRPVWSGCFWAKGEAPAEAIEQEVSFIKTDGGALIFTSTGGANGFSLATYDASVAATGNSMQLKGGSASIEMTGLVVDINSDGMKVT